MKFLHLGAISLAAIALVPSSSMYAIAQEADHVCYMTTKSGQVIDLSKSVCQLTPLTPANANAANSDQAFLTAYKQTIMGYPEIRDQLLASVNRSPESSISQAKSICNDLEAGMSLEEVRITHSEGVFNKADKLNVAFLTTLAPNYYCPQFK